MTKKDADKFKNDKFSALVKEIRLGFDVSSFHAILSLTLCVYKTHNSLISQLNCRNCVDIIKKNVCLSLCQSINQCIHLSI